MAVIPGFGVKELPFFFYVEFLFYLLEFQQLPFLSFVFRIFLPMSIMVFFGFLFWPTFGLKRLQGNFFVFFVAPPLRL